MRTWLIYYNKATREKNAAIHLVVIPAIEKLDNLVPPLKDDDEDNDEDINEDNDEDSIYSILTS